MNRRSTWIVLGLLLAVVLAAGVLWWVLSGGSRAPSRKAAGSPSDAAGSDPRDRARAVRQGLRRLGWKPDSPRILAGRVTSTQGPSIAGAVVRVVLEDGRIRVTRTNAQGEFTLVNLPPKAPRMEVSAKGYQTRTFAPMTLPSAPRARWDVQLEPAAGIHGVVLVGDTDQPAVGAGVRIVHRRRDWPPIQLTHSGLGGRFSLDWPKSGARFFLVAYHGAHGYRAIRVSEPGEVTIRLPGGGRVTGRVQDEAGRPITRFKVSTTLWARTPGVAPLQFVEDDRGRFVLSPVAPGGQRVHVYADGYQPGRSRNFNLGPGKTVDGLVVTLRPAGELYGRVTDAATGQPIRGAMVGATGAASPRLGHAVGAVTDDGGNYVLRNVQGTRTTVWAVAKGYQDLAGGGVTCPPGKRIRRDFKMTAVPQGERKRHQLTGIGAVMKKTRGGFRVMKTIDNGPAAEVLRAGDLVVQVGDDDVRGMAFVKVIEAIRGEPGTDVVLWIKRRGGPPRRVLLTRDTVTYGKR